jgi:hypothetical protein
LYFILTKKLVSIQNFNEEEVNQEIIKLEKQLEQAEKEEENDEKTIKKNG